MLWANLHLMFWLSLLPFTTSWMRTSGFAPLPTAVYGGDLLLCAIAWNVLQTTLLRVPENERLGQRLEATSRARFP